MTAATSLIWTNTESDIDRAMSTGALARRYIGMPLKDGLRGEVETALTLLLDDPSPTVRMALAEALGAAENAPINIIRCLAADIEPVAVRVLRSTQLLTDAELVDLLAEGREEVQKAVAQRTNISPAISAALCEVAGAAACLALLRNSGAVILKSSVQRLAERFSDEVDLREQLLQRSDLSITWRYRLLMKLAEKLESHPAVLERVPVHQLETFISDSGDKIVLRLALEASEDELAEFAECLRESAQLSTRLLLRAVCCGRLRLFAAALANLGGVPLVRLRRVLVSVRPSALQAILRKAGLPQRSHQAFLLAIEIARKANADFGSDLPLAEARGLTEMLLSEMQDGALGADEDVTAFVRRFAIDVARLEARHSARYGLHRQIAAA